MIKALLFDLGGVLVHFAGVGPLLNLSGGRLSEEKAWAFWWNSEVVQAFEKGRTSPEAFAAGVIAELNLNVTIHGFLDDFAQWERGPYPGALQLLDNLRGSYMLACLTNNNVVHWETLRLKSDIGSKFRRCYISFELGLLKPEPEFYTHALRDLRLNPGEVLFLDDSEKNVGAARKLGIRAYQAQGLEEVKRILKAENIL